MKTICCYIFLFSALLTTKVVAQAQFKLKGVVFENGTNLRLALGTVTNYRTKGTVGTNDMGFFELPVSLGDTLLFGKRGYNQQEIIVKSKSDLVVKLNRDLLLDEVTVYGQSKQGELDAMRKDFKDKGVFYGGKANPLLLLPFGGSPLTFLYNLLGRAPKQARRFNRMYATEVQQSQIDLYFNKTAIHKQTGLTGKALDDFMIDYRPTYDQAKQWVLYDFTKWINDSFKQYQQKHGKL